MKKVEAESLGTVHIIHLKNKRINSEESYKKTIAKTAIRNKKGITLVALVITIIVLLILAGVSIAMLTGTNGILTQAQKAKMTTELSSYKEQLELYKTEKLSENREFLESTLTVGKESLKYNTQPDGETGNIKTVIPSIKDEYIDKVEIIKGSLLINTQDKNEIEIAKSLGIAANPYDIVNGELLSSNGNLLLMDETGTLTIPDSVTKIGEGALANLDGLKTIIIPGTVKEIWANAFAYNKTLETVIMKEGVEIIGNLAFSACSKIETINIGKNVSEISPLFKYSNYSGNVKISEENKFYTVEDNILYNKNKEKLCVVLYKIEGTFILNDKLKEIGTLAFYAQYYLKNIVLNNVIETIGGSAFGFCVNLIKIEIPSTIKEIHRAFGNCNNLEEIKIHKSKNSITGAP